MSDKMKHTPGPWHHLAILGSSENSQGFKVIGPDWFGIATVAPLDETGREGEANARLIAAAPELLEALREALEWMESDWQKIDYEWGPTMEKFGDLEGAIQQRHPSTDAIRSARAAIAKATGINDAP